MLRSFPPYNHVVRYQSLPPAEKKARFYAAYQKYQNFSLPASIVRHMAKNPISPIVYQKLAASCKWFFVKNPIIVVDSLMVGTTQCWTNYGTISINFDNFDSNLWVTGAAHIGSHGTRNNCLEKFLPKVYKLNIDHLHLVNHVININDLVLITANVGTTVFSEVTVKNDDGSDLPLEKIFEYCKEVVDFNFACKDLKITNETVMNLLKIPQFNNLISFGLNEIPDGFDIETFFCHIKKTINVSFHLVFADTVSQDLKSRVDAIIDEIIATETRDYKVPLIWYNSIDRVRFDKLEDLI